MGEKYIESIPSRSQLDVLSSEFRTTQNSRLRTRHWLFGGYMDRHDPAAQISIRHLTIAYVEEHLFQAFLIREVPNGGRKIFVHAGRVMRHFCADPGKKPERIPIVQGPQPPKD